MPDAADAAMFAGNATQGDSDAFPNQGNNPHVRT